MIAPLANFSITKLGTQTTMCIGSVLTFVALMSASYATRMWQLLLSQGVCFGWGMGLLYIPASTILPQWFTTKRSLAVGLSSAGAGLGGLLYNLAAASMISRFGLGWTYRILAFCTLAANLSSSLLMKDRNHVVRPIENAFVWRECGNVEVILTILWGGFAEIGYVTLLYSLPSYALSVRLTQKQGSVVGAMLNLGLGLGRPCVGHMSDRFGRINVSTSVTLVCALLCFVVWIPATSYGALLTFALTSGVCCGIFWCTVSPVLTEVVGLQRLPSVFTVICIALVLPTTFGEPIALELEGAVGYTVTKIFVGLMFVISFASSWLLRSWKIVDIEDKATRERLREATGARGSAQARVKNLGSSLFTRRRV